MAIVSGGHMRRRLMAHEDQQVVSKSPTKAQIRIYMIIRVWEKVWGKLWKGLCPLVSWQVVPLGANNSYFERTSPNGSKLAQHAARKLCLR